jgi:hypothetical protein
MEVMPFKFEDDATVDHIKAAYRIIDEYRYKIKALKKESIKQREMVDLFGIERAKMKQIKNCKKQLTNLKLFWDSISLVTYYYDYWEKLPWQSIPIDTLTDVNKNLGLQIKRMPKEVVKGRFQHKKLQKKVK